VAGAGVYHDTPLIVATKSKLIVNFTRGTIVCEQAVVAETALRRLRGLLGRASLPSGEGLLLRPAPSIHTAFMRFPIDALFLDRDLVVLKTAPGLEPWRTASARHARAVLELSAGEIARRGIEVGDRLGMVLTAEESAKAVSIFRAAQAGGAELPRSPEARLSLVRAGEDEGMHDIRGRVLLVGADRRFRSVTAALLAGRGFEVTVAERLSDATELAVSHRAEVVVIDGGPSLTKAAHEAAKIEALDGAIGVVIVGNEQANGLAAMRVLAKWDSFDALCDAIERARHDSPAPARPNQPEPAEPAVEREGRR
jgi:uncharacterized membrane protein (UPF0127 family)/CheY-like chemotaxis protein